MEIPHETGKPFTYSVGQLTIRLEGGQILKGSVFETFQRAGQKPWNIV